MRLLSPYEFLHRDLRGNLSSAVQVVLSRSGFTFWRSVITKYQRFQGKCKTIDDEQNENNRLAVYTYDFYGLTRKF